MRTLAILIALAGVAVLLPAEAAGTRLVDVVSNSYEDAANGTPLTQISTGTTVTWVWKDGSHSVTQGVSGLVPTNPASGFSSGVRITGTAQPFSVTFPTPGDYVYYCTIHLAMRGVVRVA